jgi:hypothetical protein
MGGGTSCCYRSPSPVAAVYDSACLPFLEKGHWSIKEWDLIILGVRTSTAAGAPTLKVGQSPIKPGSDVSILARKSGRGQSNDKSNYASR